MSIMGSNLGDIEGRFLHQGLSDVSRIDNEAIGSLLSVAPSPPSLFCPSANPPSSEASSMPEFLPPFIKPLPQTLALADIYYLRAKGALQIPATSFLHGLIQSYVQYVHLFMPVVDLSTLWGIVSGDGSTISVLLLQAIMSAATAFVDIDRIREAGFATRMAARRAYYDNARVCLELLV